MNIDDNKKVEQFYQMQLMTQMFKEAMGDSPAFEIVMQSITEAMMDSNGNIDFANLGLTDEQGQSLGYGGQERVTAAIKDISSSMKSDDARIEEAVEKASKKYGIDKELINTIIYHESRFKPNVTSSAGAMGLMQLMPGTAKAMGVENPYEIEDNVMGGTKLLKNLLDTYGNSKELALAGYSAGTGTVEKLGVKSKEDIHKLPYESREFIQYVMKNYGK
ncbi:lytic transglycosylase domain-containing protein [Clostridium peptidivorans]|uniref:lytic transglycosylase domain-containing protein n=1 Tax=Clostridium peptidivorans TaxID=100174 RepID=UPI000BE3F936|nr:lytic transglycosylase domain-containing protein [Clostridium peptidivorans]